MTQLKILTDHEINHNRNKYADMVGKDVTLMSAGQQVNGVVKRIYEDEYAFHLEIAHDAVNYGGQLLTESDLFARKIDDWGSLNTVKLI